MIRALIVLAVLASGCKSEGESSDLGSTEVGSGSAKATGSSGGFSATLSADLAKGSDTPALSPGSAAAGSDVAGSGAGSGSAAAAGSAVAMTGSAGMTGSAAMTGSAGMTGSGSAAKTGSGSGSVAMTGSAAMAGSAAKSGSGSGSVAMTGSTAMAGSAAKTGSGSGSGAAPKPKPVQVPGDLAAIKISLQPNWVRDVDEAGTIALTVTVQSRDETAKFKFHYGYDLAGAPTDRDQYKKFLMEQKVLAVTADRQRGAAWYMEGVDSDGKGAFRFLVSYGGKRLVCYGSLYKDSGLGDIRDEVVIQAKKICETLTL